MRDIVDDHLEFIHNKLLSDRIVRHEFKLHELELNIKLNKNDKRRIQNIYKEQ